jgi:hypothetical protein
LPNEKEIEEAEERTDEAIQRAKNAAEIEKESRGGVEDDYAGDPPEARTRRDRPASETLGRKLA